MAQPDSGRAAAATTDDAAADLRTDRLMKAALAILGETGRTDFTVAQVVERAKTSLRAFYQRFGTKDELLLALIESIMVESTGRWRAETDGLAPTDALRYLIERISAPAESSTQHGINRGLTNYNEQLADAYPREYAQVLSPIHRLISDILSRGMSTGEFRADLDVDATAAIVMQTALGALRLRSLGAELFARPVGGTLIHEFCLRGLTR